MSAGKIINPYFDLKEHTEGDCTFFFLEHVLKARSELHLESGKNDFDQELNVYLAGLLNSLIAAGQLLQCKPYISPFDSDVRGYLEQHPGLRNEYVVYRDNADFGLILLGLFFDHTHKGSYHHAVLDDHNNTNRIALYYELAASALIHLQGRTVSLIGVYEALAEHLAEVLRILKYAATTYFDMLERLSEGSVYHLERDLQDVEEQKNYSVLVDEFLKAYSAFKEQPTEVAKNLVMELVGKLENMGRGFHFTSM